MYQVIRVETPVSPDDHPVACLGCGRVLAPRDNGFLLKYFRIGRPAREAAG
jgi:hypothetical protein